VLRAGGISTWPAVGAGLTATPGAGAWTITVLSGSISLNCLLTTTDA
jgi:hypothetical protein